MERNRLFGVRIKNVIVSSPTIVVQQQRFTVIYFMTLMMALLLCRSVLVRDFTVGIHIATTTTTTARPTMIRRCWMMKRITPATATAAAAAATVTVTVTTRLRRSCFCTNRRPLSLSSSSTTNHQPNDSDSTINQLLYNTVHHAFINTILPSVLRDITASTTTSKINLSPESTTTSTKSKMQLNPVNNDDDEDGTNNTYNMNAIIVLGVSGGCDSIALLHIMQQYIRQQNNSIFSINLDRPSTTNICNNVKIQLNFELDVLHFDHEQRGLDSTMDRILVQDTCQQYNIPCYSYFWNSRTWSNPTDIDSDNVTIDGRTLSSSSFSQDAARKWRRKAMEQFLFDKIEEKQSNSSTSDNNSSPNSYNVGMIMTAHHKDDHEETILLKLLRGVHITNLYGIVPIQSAGFTSDNSVSSSSTTNAPKSSDNNYRKNNHIYIYYIRPLLQLRKNDLIQYLQQNQYPWRDDSTNQSNKYLRNRIRNELMPLLHDLLTASSCSKQQHSDSSHHDDGESIHQFNDDDEYDETNNDNRNGSGDSNIGIKLLTKRLSNLQQQSLDIRNDLNLRVRQCMKDRITNDSKFLISTSCTIGSTTLKSPVDLNNIVMKEALYEWIKQQLRGVPVSYDQIQRVYQQIKNYPNQTIWKLDIGHHYSIMRYGSALQIISDTYGNHNNNHSSNIGTSMTRICTIRRCDDSEIINDDESRGSPLQWIQIHVPDEIYMEAYQLVQTTIARCDSVAKNHSCLVFTPPWKNSLTGSTKPIKMNNFLRGQDIPLHLRPSISVILLVRQQSSNETTTPSFTDTDDYGDIVVVAVFVPTKKKWIIDRQFSIQPMNPIDGLEDGKRNHAVRVAISVVNPE